MFECPECFCPVENHLYGIGCTTIVGYRAKIWERGVCLTSKLSYVAIALDLGPDRVEDPIVCFCTRGEAQTTKERKKRDVLQSKEGGAEAGSAPLS